VRLLSLNARQSLDSGSSENVETVLVMITHPDLDVPVRISTDSTERISADPLTYGTRSTWQTADGSPFYFCMIDALLPDDKDKGTPQARLVFSAIDNDFAAALRGTLTPATVDLAVVWSNSPDLVEQEYRGFLLVSASGDASAVTLTVTLEPITNEPWPAGRMTQGQFPGQWT